MLTDLLSTWSNNIRHRRKQNRENKCCREIIRCYHKVIPNKFENLSKTNKLPEKSAS